MNSLNHKLIGKSVIFRRNGEIDIGVVNRTGNPAGYGIISCTDQAMCISTEEPLPLVEVEMFYDYMRGHEELNPKHMTFINVRKYRKAYHALRGLVATILDSASNASEQQYEEHDALRFIAKEIEDKNEECFVRDEKPF